MFFWDVVYYPRYAALLSKGGALFVSFNPADADKNFWKHCSIRSRVVKRGDLGLFISFCSSHFDGLWVIKHLFFSMKHYYT